MDAKTHLGHIAYDLQGRSPSLLWVGRKLHKAEIFRAIHTDLREIQPVKLTDDRSCGTACVDVTLSSGVGRWETAAD